jgi:ABC-type sugar transport system substrate-binding protein
MKKFIILFLITALMISVIGCMSTKKEPEKANNQQAGNAAGQANPMALEIEKALMQQLEPMPKLNTGDKIGVLVITLANPFWVEMKNGFEAAAKELGVNVEVLAAPTEGDTRSQLETLKAMAAKDYKALILSPIEPFNLVPGVVEASKKGIKIVNLGPPIDKEAVVKAGGAVDSRISVNYKDQGRLAAEYIVKKLGDTGGKVAIIEGIPGAGQSEGRKAGAREVFEASRGIELVSIQPGNWDRNTAYNIATNLNQAHPDLKAIFCCNDVMALAASDALKAAGNREGKIIFGVDFIPEAKEAISSGKLNGSIAYSKKIYSKAALLLAMKLIQGQNVPPEVYSPLALVTNENISEYENWE